MIVFLSSLNWVDLFFLAFCALFLLIGAQKGLIKTIANTSMVLVAVVLSTLGANRLSGVLAESLSPVMAEAIQTHLGGTEALSAALSEQAAAAILGAMETTVLHIVSFTLLFLLLMLLWVLACANLSFYQGMPAVKGFDQIFGGVCGAFMGIVLSLVILYITNRFGLIDAENIESSFFVGRLLRLFPALL